MTDERADSRSRSPARTARVLSDVRLLHELTKHGNGHQTHDDRLVLFRRLDPSNRPAPFKHYLGLPICPLPEDLPVPDEKATEILSGRPAQAEGVLDDRALARLLFLAAGITRVARPPAPAEPIYFRAAMSAGNLHPVELYVVCGELPGIPAGVYHFAPAEFGLTMVRRGDFRPALVGAAGEASVASSPATLVLTGLPWRTGWKYGERGYRHLYWDAGAVLANLLAAADAGGVPVRVLAGFVDAQVCRLVGVDGTSEFPLALAVIGRGQEPAAPDTAPPVDPLDLEMAPLSPRPVTFPLVIDAQQAGALESPDAVASWRQAAGGDAPVGSPVPLPASPDTGRLDEVALQRGSTRLMRRAPVSRDVLEWGLAVAARPLPGDVDSGALVGHHVSVHDVDGVAAGAYRWRAGSLDVVRTGDFRDHTEHLCLDQPLGGDAAFTVFHTTDLDGVVVRLGARGYRAVHLAAGVAAGRLALAAFALGGGASGITFFDNEVARFFSTRESCLLATAVGAPAYRNRAGGHPRAPAELTRLRHPRFR
ncbi:MAG: SagB family peptide dehydrogenase [Acidimicrobiia bacterium]